MSTTVSYKNNTLATINYGDSKILNTEATWLEDDIIIAVDNLDIESLIITPTTATQNFSIGDLLDLTEVGHVSSSYHDEEFIMTVTEGNYSKTQTTHTWTVDLTQYFEIGDTITFSGRFRQWYSGLLRNEVTVDQTSFVWDGESHTYSISTTYGYSITITPSYVQFNQTYSQYGPVLGVDFIINQTEITHIDGYGPITINPIPSGYIVPTGTIQISGNGTYDVSSYASAEVNAASTVNNQNKTVTPSESQQTISADSGYSGLGTVTVEAISNTYVGSGIARRSSSNLTASGATVTVPAGYYASQATKSVSTTTHPNPTVSVNSSTGLITASHTQTAGYVSAGTTTGTSQLSVQAAKTITPTTTAQEAVAAGKYTTGAITVAAIPANYIDSNTLKTYYTGSTAPSSSLGANGDLYFQTTGV